TLAQGDMQVDAQTANREIKPWLLNVANRRVHATLDQRPIDLFDQEKSLLIALAPSYVSKPIEKRMPAQIEKLFVPGAALPLVSTPLQHDLAIYQALLDPSLSQEISYEPTA
ncbi:MAG TPA: hypothetical protein VEB42_06990, partial [Chitinophagaceae bacterium]|nr:hypothetical protein [Chitinophagaceae bacterium]